MFPADAGPASGRGKGYTNPRVSPIKNLGKKTPHKECVYPSAHKEIVYGNDAPCNTRCRTRRKAVADLRTHSFYWLATARYTQRLHSPTCPRASVSGVLSSSSWHTSTAREQVSTAKETFPWNNCKVTGEAGREAIAPIIFFLQETIRNQHGEHKDC